MYDQFKEFVSHWDIQYQEAEAPSKKSLVANPPLGASIHLSSNSNNNKTRPKLPKENLIQAATSPQDPYSFFLIRICMWIRPWL